MRVEKIGSATLYCGDCLEIIPTLSGIKRVCTDPPYGIEDIVGGYGRAGELIANDKTLDVCMAALQATCRVAASATWAVFYSPRVRREFFAGLPPELHDMGEIIWDKKAPGMGRGIRYQHENVALFYTGDKKTPTGDTFSVLRDYRNAKTHPHQKPTGIIQSLVTLLGDGLVFDPFLGSGTTGVVCASLGREFIGIELDPDHFDNACQRIADAAARPQLLLPANDSAPQTSDMFAANDNSEAA